MDSISISHIMIKIYDSTINLLFNIYFILSVIILMVGFYMSKSFSFSSLGNNTENDYGINNSEEDGTIFGIPSFLIHIFGACIIIWLIITAVNMIYKIDIIDIISFKSKQIDDPTRCKNLSITNSIIFE